uniref:Protein kinase domain-containing protein n=1 Tax=Marseillevirus LCMAC102 TaxID=2506603 RepID=A0A481YT80_9VIRU|nr:MAG: uncharacterized protein LCMAC102_00840 [Marseillevirus LCMAC102]
MNLRKVTQKGCIKTIHIVKSISKNVFLVKRAETLEIMKLVSVDNHPWKNLPSFKKIFPKDKDLLNRIICNYRVMSTTEIGPKFSEQICGNILIIFMEYLPIKATEELMKKYESKIQSLIKDMHNRGAVHGDLHGGNIAFTSKLEPKIIDVDTMFYLDELEDNPLPREWVENNFDLVENMEEFIEYEEEDNWRNIPD